MFTISSYNSQRIFMKFSFSESPCNSEGLDWKKIRKNPESGEKSGIFCQNVLLHNGVYSTAVAKVIPGILTWPAGYLPVSCSVVDENTYIFWCAMTPTFTWAMPPKSISVAPITESRAHCASENIGLPYGGKFCLRP